MQHYRRDSSIESALVTSLALNMHPATEPAAVDPANDRRDTATVSPVLLLSAAILQNRCLQAAYNNGQVVLQPAALYTEHDALFLLAVAALRDGNPPREPKLGTFRVSGLKDLDLLDEAFEPTPLHQSWVEKPSWQLITSLPRP